MDGGILKHFASLPPPLLVLLPLPLTLPRFTSHPSPCCALVTLVIFTLLRGVCCFCQMLHMCYYQAPNKYR